MGVIKNKITNCKKCSKRTLHKSKCRGNFHVTYCVSCNGIISKTQIKKYKSKYYIPSFLEDLLK